VELEFFEVWEILETPDSLLEVDAHRVFVHFTLGFTLKVAHFTLKSILLDPQILGQSAQIVNIVGQLLKI